MTALLQVNNLSRTFHRRGQTVQAVDNVSFSINAGETWALVGESGSGKSTTGRLILGLTPASGGEVHFEGQSLLGQSATQWQRVRREMQMIFQDPLSSLDPKRSIGYSLEEPLIIHGVKIAKHRSQKCWSMWGYGRRMPPATRTNSPAVSASESALPGR